MKGFPMQELFKEYKKNPSKCPICQGAVEGGPVTIDSNEAYQDVTCTDCGSNWRNRHFLQICDDLELTPAAERILDENKHVVLKVEVRRPNLPLDQPKRRANGS
jgi:hypothetical protein